MCLFPTRLRFTVVSEPPEEFQEDAECVEVGYAYVDLRALLQEGRDLTDSDIEGKHNKISDL